MVRFLGRFGGISSVFILWLSKMLQWYVTGAVIVPHLERFRHEFVNASLVDQDNVTPTRQ